MSSINLVLPIPLTSFSVEALTESFQVINIAGLPRACFLFRLTNSSDVDVVISYDGKTAHDYLISKSTLQLSLPANTQLNNMGALLKQGSKIYVKGAGAGTGSIYLSGYYQAKI